MTFIVKICGNKPSDIAGMFTIIDAFRREQLHVFGKQKIDPRIGILVGRKHPSPDFVEVGEAASIIGDSPAETMVVVTHLDTIAELVDMIGETGARTIQLHKKDPIPEHVEELKKLYPDRRLWHVIHAAWGQGDPARQLAEQRDAVARAHELIAAGVEVIVLDTYDSKSGRVGGTGIAVNPRYARKFRDAYGDNDHSGRLVIAGGLQPSNVVNKIRTIGPDGIDANTGLNMSEHNRAKDPLKVQSFFEGALEGAYGLRLSGLWAPS